MHWANGHTWLTAFSFVQYWIHCLQVLRARQCWKITLETNRSHKVNGGKIEKSSPILFKVKQIPCLVNKSWLNCKAGKKALWISKNGNFSGKISVENPPRPKWKFGSHTFEEHIGDQLNAFIQVANSKSKKEVSISIKICTFRQNPVWLPNCGRYVVFWHLPCKINISSLWGLNFLLTTPFVKKLCTVKVRYRQVANSTGNHCRGEANLLTPHAKLLQS